MSATALRSLQVFLLALGVLIFEVALTRIFSFMLFHHLTYLVISVGLLGFGAAGTYLTVRGPRDDDEARRFVPRFATLFGLGAIAAVAIIPRLHFYFEDIYALQDYSNLISLFLIVILAGIPFFGAGCALGLLVSRAGEDVNRIYGADLVGAALGSLLAIPAISGLGGTGSALAVGALALFVALVSEDRHRKRRLALFLGAALFAGFVAKTNWLTLYAPPDKPLFRNHGLVERIEWHPIARLDVTIPIERHHSFGGALSNACDDPPPKTRLVYQDGGALTGIIQPEPTPEATSMLGYYMQGSAYVVKPNAQALVLGCGGGVDIEIALHNGARYVVGVDVNSKTIRLMQTTYAEFARGVFQRDDVQLITAEARHFLTRDDRKYDVIQLSGVDTYTALAAGAYALTEYYVYTREAIDQYLDHLTDDGIVCVSRPLLNPPRETLKLAITVVEALRDRGAARPEDHVIVLSGQGQGSFFGVPWGQTMVRRTPWTPEDVAAIEAWATAREFRVVYAPFDRGGRGMLARYYRSTPDERARMIEEDLRELTPATDDRPFFFHFYPAQKLWSLHFLRSKEPPLDIATMIALATLVQVVGLSAALILWPLVRRKTGPVPRGESAGLFVYFAAVGLAFILIEIALMQKFTVFLGGPTYSMGVTLFSILLASGIGSMLSQRWSSDPSRFVRVIVPLLAAVAVLGSFLWDPLIQSFMGLPQLGRGAAVAAMVAPAGLLMGMPFPAGLRWVNRRRPELAPWGWGVNAFATVLGTVVCVLFTTGFGFNRTIQLGAAIYLLGWLAWLLTQRSGSPAKRE